MALSKLDQLYRQVILDIRIFLVIKEFKLKKQLKLLS